MESRLVGIALALVIGVGVVGYRFSQKGDRGEEVREEVMGYLQELPDYETHASLYNAWFDTHHDMLFERHYHIGGRRSPARFDGDEYLYDLFTAMVVDAKAEGYDDQAEQLRELGDSLYMESE